MRCKFITRFWMCPLEALEGEEYCYWHLPKDGKTPNEEKLKELKENEIMEVYLVYADLSEKDLRRAYLAGANLQGANLEDADLQGVNLVDADLQGAWLMGANLQRADLIYAYLQGADLWMANLQGANLGDDSLQGVDLEFADLQGANLSNADLRQANLVYARVNSETILDEADLRFANIYRSYLDETKTLRNAKIGEYDIHEILADLMGKKRYIFLNLNFSKIKEEEPEIASKLKNFVYVSGDEEQIINLVYYVGDGKTLIIFDKNEKKVVRLDFDDKGKLKKEHIEIPELNKLIDERLDEFIFLKDKEEIKEFRAYLYDCAYEVYNNLYYFYIQNGKLDEALEMHYRRSEARRKALKLKGKLNWLRSWIYDFLILKVLTGYGTAVGRPLLISIAIILLYAFLFWLTKGIVKVVNGKEVNPDFIDYIYHSIITFTSLGYANIQPNLSVGHIPQILAASESCLGALMIALLIFTITFRVSR